MIANSLPAQDRIGDLEALDTAAQQGSRRRWRTTLLPAAVLLIGIVLTVVASQSVRTEMIRDAQSRLDITAANAAVQVERRFAAYFEVLVGVRAMIHAVDHVSREEFHRYAQALALKRNFPGFQALSFAPYVRAGSEGVFEEAQRSDPSLPQDIRFSIHPPGARDGYHPFTLIEPMAENQQYLGKDIAFLPVVRASLELARDTGEMTSSASVFQPKEPDGHVGLAVRLPLYRNGMPIDTVEHRRGAYLGSVGAGIWMVEMLARLPGVPEGVRLRLFDGGLELNTQEPALAAVIPSDTPLFDTDNPSGRLQAPGQPETSSAGQSHSVRSFALAGRRWIVEASAPVEGDIAPLERMLPALILMAGAVISVLLAGVIFGAMGSQHRASVLAFAMTRRLRTSGRHLAEAQAMAKLGSWILDPRTGAVECSDEARRIYGLTATSVSPTFAQLLALLPELQRAGLREAVERAEQGRAQVAIEHLVRESDGTERWVNVNLQRSTENGLVTVRATVRDETASKRAALRLALAHDIARELAGEATPETAAHCILSLIGVQLGWDAAACWIVGDDAQVRCLTAWAPPDDAASQEFAAALRGFSGPRQGGNLDAAWASTNPLWRAIAITDAVKSLGRDQHAFRCGLHVALVVPVLAGSRLVALEFFSRAPIGVDREIESFMRSIASQFAQYLQRKQAETALRHVAHHDALTGLANRSLLEERLGHAIQRAERQKTKVAVLFMDLDRFKHVNDNLGHGTGDLLLRACADRLRQGVRASDTVARFGGDEFVVVLEGLNSSSDALASLTKISSRFNQPFDVDGRELRSTASIGVSVFPDDGRDVETLLMHADAAMYQAKSHGPGNHHFYSRQMNTQDRERLELESCLPHAIERGELFVVYQPKLSVSTGKISGVEALMRWQHPTLGLISPLRFIPIAEETGLIDGFGHWILEVACRDAKIWQGQGQLMQVSVNLSARQLDRPLLAEEVAQVLATTGLAPAHLELEITESAVMRNPAQAATRLRDLRSLGISLAIDDFGTGYSSLSYLRTFPLCTLKIDRSFIRDIPSDENSAALTAGIIALAHRLRMKVVAEGVETLAQLSFLRANSCDEIQGYFLSKAISAEEISLLLQRDLRKLIGPAVAA